MSENLIKLRVYKYNSLALNGCGEELQNVMIGGKITSCLDDTLDTAEISINGVSESEPYKPLTKFVVVLEQENQETQYYHYELRYDSVEKLSMSDNLYKHTLYLGNPAISCQKRTCDNFAISYRIKDVRLDDTSIDSGFSQRTKVGITKPSINQVRYLNTKYNFGSTTTAENAVRVQTGKWLKWVRNSYNGDTLTNTPLTELNNLNYMILIDNGKLTEDLCKKFKDNYSATRSKFQIFNYDSSNQYYGTNGAYKECFESVPSGLVSNGIMHYVIPQLCAYSSKTNNNIIDQVNANTSITIPSKSTDVDSGASNLILMPTKTTVKKISILTGELVQKTTYTSLPSNDSGQINSIDSPKTIYSFVENKYGVRKKNPLNMSSSIIVGYDYIQSDNPIIKTISPIFMEMSNAALSKEINIIIESGYKYEITTQAYFGSSYDRYAYKYVKQDEYEKVKYVGTGLNENELMKSMYFYGFGGENELLIDKVNASDFTYSVNFSVYDISDQQPLPLLKGQSSIPNCYDLFKKAQICSKTINFDSSVKTWDDIESQDLPYVVSNELSLRLQSQSIIEDKYYDKNLWEMFMQIGKYIHAKPYIRFYGDKYELKFKDYGISEKSTKKATTNSVFSNNNIEDYISSLDSYLENYFEYGNEIEEYIKPTDNDGSSICTNDNAVLKTKYSIMEITGLYVSKKSSIEWKDITDYIYEYNVYKILSTLDKADPSSITSYLHFKGNSLYYHLNGTQILGLQNVEPSINSDKPYAIKRVIAGAMGIINETAIGEIQVNDYTFKITYRTKDDVRFKTFKPDLRKFILNASNDNYPIQSQFSNQSDKVVDSNKYGNNTYGTLLRSGNDTLDYQEYITELNNIKDSGELYDLGNQYYVSKNTMVVYPTYIECEVEYSKDYNKLSEIIGIDSAPRFYEIAEDGSIKRNICVDKLYQIGVKKETDKDNYITLAESKTLQKISIGAYDPYKHKYALVHFSGAPKSFNQDTNDFSSYVLVPCIEYATGNTLTLECDMEDNFGAGERQNNVSNDYKNCFYNSSWLIPILTALGVAHNTKLTGTLTQRQSVQYCDVYGKADLISFAFINNIVSDNNSTMIETLPSGKLDVLTLKNKNETYVNQNIIGSISRENETITESPIVLDKDSRETIGINYSIHLLTESDRFILSNTLFKQKKTIDNLPYINWVVYYYDTEINKMERDTLTNYENNCLGGYVKGAFPIEYSSNNQAYIELYEVGAIPEYLDKIKSVALGYEDAGVKHFVIARNVSEIEGIKKLSWWYFTKPKFN